VRDFLYVRPLDTLVALDRVESTSNMTAATGVTKTFLLHFPNNPTLGANTALATKGNQALRLFTLVPAGQLAPSYVLVKEKMTGQSRSTSPQFRLEETTSGQPRSYLINVMQARDATGQDITATLTENSSSFTITLSHATLGTAVIKLGKGMASTGGSFGYATSGIPLSMTPLATSVQAIPGSY
jgi:hypothetical protein